MPLNVASVCIFDGEISFRDCLHFVESKLAHIPRYLKRVASAPFGIGLPSWEFDREFHLRRHVREHKLKEGTEAELKELAGKLFSQVMDRSHPLWDMTLVRGLQDRFPKARLIGGDAEFETLVAKVVGFVEAPAQGLDLPLDLRGTAFQQRVWEALRKIPAGRTATYTDIAKRIGRPKAVRAVAAACADNPVAVAIPCHRVVRLDGNLAGYRWGIARKRALLDKEAAA